jgi:hypothetical protein
VAKFHQGKRNSLKLLFDYSDSLCSPEQDHVQPTCNDF